MVAQRSPKEPEETATTRSPGETRLTTADSKAPVPDGIDGTELLGVLRDRHGVTLAPGQAHLKGKIFRIGHIGWFDVFDITTQIGAVELVLADLGADVERGSAVTAALEAFAGEPSRIAANASSPIEPRVSGVSGRCSVRKSAAA